MAGLANLLLMLSVLADEPAPQEAAAPEAADGVVQLEDVEVQGRRGVALVDPEVELDGTAIDALGAYDIGDAVSRLAEDYALGVAPMIIVNGRRMADPGVFSGFPADALVRLEVLPPEAAALYGAADPSRRVVNIVLQRRFSSRDGRTRLERPTAGGMSKLDGDLRQSSILDARTRQLGLQVAVDTALRAGERDQGREGWPDGGAVTLRSPSESVAVRLIRTGEIGDWSASLNANARALETRSVSLAGGEPVESRRRSQGLTLTGGLNGDAAGWSVQAALNGSLSRSDQSGLSLSDTRQQAATASLGLGRALFDLPAGPVALNLSGRASRSRSRTERSGQARSFSGLASDLNGSLLIPLLRRRPDLAGLVGALGDLSMTVGANLSETDAGRGDGVNVNLTWAPGSRFRFNGAWSTATQSVSDQQRFDPEYYGEPTRVFDFLRGETVEVLPILGGNPDLRPPRSEQLALSVSAGPFTPWALQGSVNYQRSEAVDEIGALPDPTPEVEAAFPDRFRRDADGRLVSIDQRPVNFSSALTEALTTSVGAAFPLGDADAGGRQGVLRLLLNHSWRLATATTIREGLPGMDRLSGDGGGLSRHQLSVAADIRQGRWGMNVVARWREGYRMRRDSGRDGQDDLRVGAFSAVDLKFSYRFERDLPREGQGGPARRGSGLLLELEVANLLDARPDALLGDGRPAPGYGRDDQDPIGRTIAVTLKRRF